MTANEKPNTSQTYNTNYDAHNNSVSTTASSTYTDVSTQHVYKMRAHRKHGKRSPTQVEFYLDKRPMKYTKIQRAKQFCSNCSSTNKTQLNEMEANESLANNSKIKHNFFSKDKFKLPKFRKMNLDSMEQIDEENISKNNLDVANQNIEIYYFDHGNSAYFRTTDYPPHIFSENIVQQTTLHATRFWAEIYGSIHIGIAFLMSFVLQTFRFLLYSIIRPLVIGLLQMFSDYFIKPLLTIIFNGLLQPPIILCYNIFSSISDLCEPIAKAIGYFIEPFANFVGQIRLIEINHYRRDNDVDVV